MGLWRRGPSANGAALRRLARPPGAHVALRRPNSRRSPRPSARAPRSFGELSGQADDRYHEVWAEDARDASHEEFGVESVLSVRERARGVVEALESESALRDGRRWMVVLVAHGDVLQVRRRPPQPGRCLPPEERAGAGARAVHLSGESPKCGARSPPLRARARARARHAPCPSQILQTAFAPTVDPRAHRSLEHLPTATLRGPLEASAWPPVDTSVIDRRWHAAAQWPPTAMPLPTADELR